MPRKRVEELAQVGGVEIDVGAHAAVELGPVERVLEQVAVDAHHDVAEHLHEPAVGVEREALVAAARSRGPAPSGRSGPG